MTVDLRKITRTSICVCHPPTPGRYRDFEPGTGREIVLRDGSTEWEHADDATAAATHHIHVERYATDCDGAHGDDYVNRPDCDDKNEADPFGYWLSHWHYACSPSSDNGTATFSSGQDANGTWHRVEWSARTDEGGESETRTLCLDPDCAYEQGSVYDQYAQLSNY